MKAGLKLIGNIYKDVQKYQVKLRRGVTMGNRDAAIGLKLGLREQVKLAQLGYGVEKSWQAKHYPEGKYSLDAASIVYTKAPKIISGFDRGSVIRSKHGIYLAIPTEDAPEKYAGKATSPTNWPEHRFGKLRFVEAKRGGLAFLVADDLRESYSKKTGQFRGYKKASQRAIKQGKDLDGIAMFILVKQARLKKTLDVEREWRKWGAKQPELINRRVNGNGL